MYNKYLSELLFKPLRFCEFYFERKKGWDKKNRLLVLVWQNVQIFGN